MHDDHITGFPYLAKHHNTRIWCFENLVDILQNPRGRNLGCTLGEAVQVDRVIHDRETFRWEEFEFTAVHSPGHTDYQMALFSNIDGVRLAFTGDAFFHDSDRPFQIRHNLIYRNRVNSGDHLKPVQNLTEFQPEIICPGHGEPFLIDRNMIDDFRARIERRDELFRTLIADRDTDTGLDPSPVEIVPYQAVAAPGGRLRLELHARNHRDRPVELQIGLVLPTGWRCDPKTIAITTQARGSGKVVVSVEIPADFDPSRRRIAIAAHAIADGTYPGQIAEAVIDFRTSSS